MKKMNIIYEDKELLVIDKEPNLLTIKRDKGNEHNLYNEASTYVKKQYPKNKVFIVNRLDKETSGLVVFAKNQAKKEELQNNWSQVTREYYCIVEGHLKDKKGVLKDYLAESKTLEVYITKDHKKGKLAITEYEVLKENKDYSLLKINIKTGRRNQIRIQLSNINHPIIGDKKYHSTKNPLKRLGLHAYLIEYQDKNKKYHFETKYPSSFSKIF